LIPGHRRSLTMKKGHSIYQFLQKALEDLRPDFTELRTVTADQLMYVKEDLILPQTNTFYDFIVTKVRIKRVVNMLDFLGSCSIHVDTEM
jgi:protein FAM50